MKRLLCFLVPCLLALTMRAANSPAVTAALRADEARIKALMASDGAALARVLSDDMKLVHSDGRVEGKAEYIKNLMAGDTAYADVKTTQVETVETNPNVVVILGAQTMRKKLGPTWSDINLRFLSVWRNENGAWRMIAWQSARPAGTSVVPPKK
jgi:ketosteroid isomerase-like protein